MDCDKFEPLLLDELYEELDELTSAAVKRHVAGCARCASILSGMKATRRMVSLPLVPAPAGLEERIFAAAKEAEKVVPIMSRMSRAVSIAGSWAMRPQTAMAAVFLLMIGTTTFLIRSKNYASKDAAVSVTVAGEPAPIAPAPESESLDDKAAAAAHGPTPPNITRPAAPAASMLAMAESTEGDGLFERTFGAAHDEAEKARNESASLGSTADDTNTRGLEGRGRSSATASPIANTAAPGGAGGPYDGLAAQAPAQPNVAKASSGRADAEQAHDPFTLGAAAFRARNYAEATRQYDIAAQNGDLNAALWAAESTREGQGCAVALGRFDQLSQKAAGSWIGDEASLRAARCQMAMSQLDAARVRLDKLAHGSTHQQQAKQTLVELDQLAARKAGGSGASGGAVAAPRAASPAARPASPARAPAESREQKKAADHATGF